MKRKRRARSMPSMMLQFSRQDQRRFVEAVERFQSLVNDLAIIVDKQRRKKIAADGKASLGNDAHGPEV